MKYFAVALIVIATLTGRIFSTALGFPERQQDWWAGLSVVVVIGTGFWFAVQAWYQADR